MTPRESNLFGPRDFLDAMLLLSDMAGNEALDDLMKSSYMRHDRFRLLRVFREGFTHSLDPRLNGAVNSTGHAIRKESESTKVSGRSISNPRRTCKKRSTISLRR